MQTASQQQIQLMLLFSREQAEMLQLIIGPLQDRVAALEQLLGKAVEKSRALGKTPHDQTNIARQLSPAWADDGPMAFGKSAAAGQLREFSRPWRRIISILRTDPGTAMMVFDGLGITITPGPHGSKLFCHPASAVSFDEAFIDKIN